MLNAEQIIEQCKISIDLLTDKVREDLVAVQAAGYEHGKAGTYALKDMSAEDGDTDWFWDVGVGIELLEDLLQMREGRLLRIYKTAYREGRAVQQ